MDSILNHATMLRSKLRNKFLKRRSINKDKEAYRKQQNLCVSLLRQNKKVYFETLDIKSVTGNKMFGKQRHNFSLINLRQIIKGNFIRK